MRLMELGVRVLLLGFKGKRSTLVLTKIGEQVLTTKLLHGVEDSFILGLMDGTKVKNGKLSVTYTVVD